MKKKDADDGRLKRVLKQIQLRAQVQLGQSLTHSDLADLAGVSKRSLGDWMRGVSAPTGMNAILELLSHLDEANVSAVLSEWRVISPSTKSENKSPGSKVIKADYSREKVRIALKNKKTSK